MKSAIGSCCLLQQPVGMVLRSMRFTAVVLAVAAGSLPTSAAEPEEAVAAPSAGMQAALAVASELRGEVEATKRVSEDFAAWCGEAEEHWSSMSAQLQRRFDRAESLQKQVSADERRLLSELQVAEQQLNQQQEQLKSAAATSSMALSELDAEQGQVSTVLSAAQKAEHLLHAQGMLASHQQDDASQLVQALHDMSASLQQEKSAVAQEGLITHSQMAALSNRMNSSLLRLETQVASLQNELTHRRRESSLLQGKMEELQSILHPVASGGNSTKAVCAWAAKASSLAQTRLGKDVESAKVLLAQLSPAAPVFLQLNSAKSASPQQQGGALEAASQQHIEDDLSSLSALADSVAASDAPEQQSAPPQKKKAQQPEEEEITAASLPGHANAKLVVDAAAEQSAATADDKDGWGEWCKEALKAAQQDSAAARTSRQHLEEQLAVTNGTANDHEADSSFYLHQTNQVAKELKQLGTIQLNERTINVKESQALKSSLAHLQSVIAASPQQAGKAQEMQGRIQQYLSFKSKVHASFERHANLLHKRSSAVLESLQAAVTVAGQKLSGYEGEVKLLSTLARAKLDDQMLTDNYQGMVTKLCRSKMMRSTAE
mmetsp:Transcript_36265/g.85081  ORF Transcript_36265/g.85081 Transcript_36265/m.85081 type:complete len:604 (+) Transcript_36265:142-1953(+)